ncbi:hypothetical protein [Hyphococcus sp.]|uniref:hypothetical protein n=2 Tax=Hyphococcus sp. TaxID=2038636 RepID=UPI0035C761CE
MANRHINILAGAALALFASQTMAQTGDYTVNGEPVAPEMQKLMAHYGIAPGAYFIDAYGNYGPTGAAPAANVDGGPPRGWSGVEPRGTANNPYAQAYVNGVSGVRIFWVYSPSIFSGATGGSSGYVHVCPGNVFYRSSEGAVNVGGDYNSKTGANDSWAGVAGAAQSAGRWGVEDGPDGPVLALYDGEGGAQRVALATMLQGSWKFGQTKYAAEAGKASC